MAMIYAFQQEGDSELLKIGFAKNGWRQRFRDQQPCNPRTLKVVGAFEFADERECKLAENRIKAGHIYPHAPGTSERQEWYTAKPEDFLSLTWLKTTNGVSPVTVATTLDGYRDDLNPGDVNGKWTLFLYLIGEERESGFCKLRATAYNWADASSVYLTGNPRRPTARRRWLAPNGNICLLEIRKKLARRFAAAALPYEWFKLDTSVLENAILESVKVGELIECPRDPLIDRRCNSKTEEYRRIAAAKTQA